MSKKNLRTFHIENIELLQRDDFDKNDPEYKPDSSEDANERNCSEEEEDVEDVEDEQDVRKENTKREMDIIRAKPKLYLGLQEEYMFLIGKIPMIQLT